MAYEPLVRILDVVFANVKRFDICDEIVMSTPSSAGGSFPKLPHASSKKRHDQGFARCCALHLLKGVCMDCQDGNAFVR